MGYKCAVVDCKNNRYYVTKQRKQVYFHSFPPLKNDLRKRWISFCKRGPGWVASKHDVICSAHFTPEDYQMQKSPLFQFPEKSCNIRLYPTAVPRIRSDVDEGDAFVKNRSRNAEEPDDIADENEAVPSIKEETDISRPEADRHESFADVNHPQAINASLPNYREQFCRTCLKHCPDDSSIPVASQIQNMVVLDMLVHLTGFETDDSDEFPSVICLECKNNLVQAFNIRQEFIVKAEFLVQLVAEEKLADYFHTIEDKAQKSMKPRTSKRFIFTDINQAYRNLSIEPLFPINNPASRCSPGILDENNGETIKHELEQHESDISDINDHSCYAKVVDGNEDPATNNDLEQQTGPDERTVKIEDTCTRSNTPDIQSDENLEQSDAWNEFMVNYEKEKSMKRKLKSEQRRALKSQRGRQVNVKLQQLEEEARLLFPLTTCYVCDKQHDSMMECDFHMREHIPMLPYQCNECMVENNETEATETGESFQPLELKTVNKLNFHLRMHRLPHKCDKCYRRFGTITRLKGHVSNAHACEETGFTCEYCGKHYTHRVYFRSHVDSHRNELSGQYKCSICDRSFGAKNSLQRHLASHTGEKKYKCMYCDKSFSTSYNRLNHHRIHTGERPHKCLECGRAFAQSTALLKHTCTPGQVRPSKLRNDSGPPLLPSKDGRCPYPGCDYTATTYGAMYVHKRTKHTTLYQCKICNKSYAFANQLNAHLRLHTGEKPYQCNLCERSFRDLQIYRRHLKTHTTDTSFACEICQKSFKLPQYLQAHMQTHSSERKFSCEICGNCYKTKGELKKHIQRKHGDENNDSRNEDGIIIKVEFCEEVPTSNA